MKYLVFYALCVCKAICCCLHVSILSPFLSEFFFSVLPINAIYIYFFCAVQCELSFLHNILKYLPGLYTCVEGCVDVCTVKLRIRVFYNTVFY